MKPADFYDRYRPFQWKDKIVIQCGVNGCSNKEHITKAAAWANFKRNNGYRCRSCSYTTEGKEKIAKATSYKRSEETRTKMSEAKKQFYQTTAGEAYKKKQSKLAAEGHATNKFENAKRGGLYPSSRSGRLMPYSSSYELRLCWMLDQPQFDDLKTYQTQVTYEVEGRGRSLDFLLEYKDGSFRAIEVKPKKRLSETENESQINDSRENAEKHGWKFDVFTEDDFGMSYIEIRDWADVLRKTLTGIDYPAFKKESDLQKAKKHYDSKLSERITVYCEHCKEEHMMRKAQHDRNVEKNGRYICIKENGKIIGERSKDYLKKENPYAAEGKKQCLGVCGQILDLDCFGNDKSRDDGKADRCKACRAAAATAKYQAKKTS